MRIIIDESASFGVLGQTGRGLTEHFDIPVSWNCLRLCDLCRMKQRIVKRLFFEV